MTINICKAKISSRITTTTSTTTTRMETSFNNKSFKNIGEKIIFDKRKMSIPSTIITKQSNWKGKLKQSIAAFVSKQLLLLFIKNKLIFNK